ncbi:MAG: Gfo/Idh/MocA family oxidoreductase [Solirubrobacterales bacterium]
MRVGLCGLGEIGQHHLAAIRSCPDLELAAVCDLDEELARRDAGRAAVHTRVERMLATEQLDAVDICLPHSLHREVAERALAADCDVLLEKPLAVDLGGCDAIVAAARAAGRRVAVSHNQLFYGPHRRLAELIAAGGLGELQGLYARLWIGGRYGGWRADPELVGGGLLMDAGVHRIYCLRALGGPVSAVTATMDRPRDEESFSVTMEFASGALGAVQGSYHCPEGTFDDRLDVVGSDGLAAVAGCEAFFEGDLSAVAPLRTRIEGVWEDDPVGGTWADSVRDSVQQSLMALERGGELPVGVTAGREAVALIEAAYRSAECRERVLVEELDKTEAL